jgi:hypothetical protein
MAQKLKILTEKEISNLITIINAIEKIDSVAIPDYQQLHMDMLHAVQATMHKVHDFVVHPKVKENFLINLEEDGTYYSLFKYVDAFVYIENNITEKELLSYIIKNFPTQTFEQNVKLFYRVVCGRFPTYDEQTKCVLFD